MLSWPATYQATSQTLVCVSMYLFMYIYIIIRVSMYLKYVKSLVYAYIQIHTSVFKIIKHKIFNNITIIFYMIKKFFIKKKSQFFIVLTLF